MAKKRTNTFAKRARERAKLDKRKEKEERKAQRRAEKENGDDDATRGVDPDIAGIVPGPQPLPVEALDPSEQVPQPDESEDDDEDD